MIKRVVELRKRSSLPIIVSGDFTPNIIPNVVKEDWNIIIVGRAIVNSPVPQKIIEQILNDIYLGGR